MLIHRCRFVDFTPHSITALAFNQSSASDSTSPNLRLAVGRANGDIEIWNPRYKWVCETTFKGGRDRSIEGLVWSHVEGNYRLFSTGGSTSITEWSLKTGLPLVDHECNSGIIWSIAVSPDSKKIAAGCDNGSVSVLNLEGGPGVAEHYKILQRHTSKIMCIAWLNDDQLAGGCSDGRVRVWSLKAGGRIIATMTVDKARHEETIVWSLISANNGEQIVTGDSTGSVKFWNASNFSLSKSFKVHEADVLCLTVDQSSRTVFSAGVDRKIATYKAVKDGTSKRKWVNANSRLIHSHDIRALALFESKNVDYLISGGVEKTLVINSVKQFENGSFRKIHITRQKPCVLSVPSQRYIALQNDQSVKIWKVDRPRGLPDEQGNEEKGKGRHLVSKITLNSEEHISAMDISEDGSVLAVCTVSETKIFDLRPSKSADGDFSVLKVGKRSIPVLKDLGGSLVRFVPKTNKFLVVVTTQSEIVVCDLETSTVTCNIEFPIIASDTNGLDYTSAISHISINSDLILAAAAPSGSIDLFDLKKGSHIKRLINLQAPISSISFSLFDRLIVVTAEIRILEFDLKSYSLTEWSRQNSDHLPKEIINQQEKCVGIFSDSSTPDRIWFWGANWLAFVDVSTNIPVQRLAKRKFDDRNGDASSISDNGSIRSNGVSPMSPSIGREAFFITQKYRPMVLAGTLGPGEIVVSERPVSLLPQPPAFWSNHKIAL